MGSARNQPDGTHRQRSFICTSEGHFEDAKYRVCGMEYSGISQMAHTARVPSFVPLRGTSKTQNIACGMQVLVHSHACLTCTGVTSLHARLEIPTSYDEISCPA
ncbi:hypothetical protein CDAR_197801 [Caerostris darwini]|uniref:Uncharacterized protein n=1 Tax=Caerostris darwini TaxID=1538125 RepID=A0AAV4SD15_9ARAC|nr:hypothetical protein CDAR_197801 [Caerostris darwini]